MTIQEDGRNLAHYNGDKLSEPGGHRVGRSNYATYDEYVCARYVLDTHTHTDTQVISIIFINRE